MVKIIKNRLKLSYNTIFAREIIENLVKSCISYFPSLQHKSSSVLNNASSQPSHFYDRLPSKKAAFSLAETLVTLAIIGIVAAITIPGLVTKVDDIVKTTRIKNIERKLHQGTNTLMFLGKINGYKTTEDFIKALSEHMKIITYCSANKIAECFPYDKINVDGDEGTVNVADLKTAAAFGLNKDEYSNPVSFITGDGTPYIISYKKDCAINDDARKANPMGCIVGIYDWNGPRKPNKYATETKNGENITTGDIMTIGGVTKLAGKKVIPTDGSLNPGFTACGRTYTKFKYIGYKYCGDDGNQDCTDETGIYTCSPDNYAQGMGNSPSGGGFNYCSSNKWYAAVKKCESLELELPCQGGLYRVYYQKTTNSALKAKLVADGALNSYFWSYSTGGYTTAYYVNFNNLDARASYVNQAYRVICLGE